MTPNRLLSATVAAVIAAALLTPTATAAVPAVTDQVVLNEVLVTPEDDGVEAVELYNPTSEDVNVTGWELSDRDFCVEQPNATQPRVLEGSIEAGGTHVVELPNPIGGLSCLNLAQASDYLEVRDGSGALVDSVCWGSECADHTHAHEAPGDVAAGDTIHRCFVASGVDEGLADEDQGEVDWDAGPATLDRPNPPCV